MTLKIQMTNIEAELKWELDQKGWFKLQTLLEVKKELTQENRFYDDKAFTLREARWALRLRNENDSIFLAAKGPAEQIENLSKRTEIEVEISSKTAEEFKSCSRLDQNFKPTQFLFEIFGDLKLFQFMSFKNDRKVLLWRGYELELDHSRCLESERYELEWETEAEKLLDLKHELESWLSSEGVSFKPSSEGKLSWAIKEHSQALG